jgi:hypothetical protein
MKGAPRSYTGRMAGTFRSESDALEAALAIACFKSVFSGTAVDGSAGEQAVRIFKDASVDAGTVHRNVQGGSWSLTSETR